MAAKQSLVCAAFVVLLSVIPIRDASGLAGVTVSGRVTIVVGQNILNTKDIVRVFLRGGPNTSTITQDFDYVPGGEFKLQNVPPGTYSLTVRKRAKGINTAKERTIQIVVGDKDISGLDIVIGIPVW